MRRTAPFVVGFFLFGAPLFADAWGGYYYDVYPGAYTYEDTYWYSYPQYQSDYYGDHYWPSPSYGYESYPSYTPYYMSGGEYCYSGYGCYPFYVEDPHQWIYDRWTGTWY